MSMDTIASGDGPGQSGPYDVTPAPRAATTGLKMTALTSAVSLVLVGGVVTAAYRASGGSVTPDHLMPASAFGYAQLDLSLPNGQSDAIDKLISKFPDAPPLSGSGSLRDRLLTALFKSSSDPHVDYATELKPWLGDRVAVAGWIDSNKKPELEGVIESTDDAAAREQLKKIAPDVGVAFSDGYAVLAQTQALANEAVASAKSSSLAGNSIFTGDVASLPSDEAAIGWLDGGGAIKAFSSSIGGVGGAPLLGSIGTFGLGGLSRMVKARMVVGVHVTDTTVQLDFRERGGSIAKQTGSDLIAHLPGGTIAAADIGAPAGIVTGVTTAISAMFTGFESSVTSSASGCAIAVAPSQAPTATASPQPVPAVPPSCSPSTTTTETRTRIDPLAQIEKVTGLKLPGDAVTLLGSGAVIAYGGLSTGGPNVALRSRPADVSAAQAVAEKLRAALADSAHLDLAVRTAGSDLVVATNGQYADAVAGTGDLGTSPAFKEAMGDLPADVAFAAYADLSKLLPLFDHGQADLNKLKAIGFWVGAEGTDEVAQLRLVIG
jgi:hypothetical protein